MAITYTNRQGKTYYLHQGTTKKGNPTYFFAMHQDGVMTDTIPDGYEIYENPNAQVYLRKIKAKVITDEEIAIVDSAIRSHANVKKYIIDTKGKIISIYLPDQNIEALEALFQQFPQRNKKKDIWNEILTYSPMMQFEIVDIKKRLFVVNRYCFLGSIDDWITVSDPKPLDELAGEFVQHLGEDSYFELY